MPNIYSRRERIVYAGFDPSAISKVSAWLRNDTVGANAVASVTEVIGGNHAVQTVAGRRPTGDAALSMTFATNDALSWPLNAANNQTTKTGVAFWMKQPVSALEVIFAIYNGAGGASARKWFFQTNTARRLVVGAFVSGNDGRQLTTPVNSLPAAGTSCFVRASYDSSLGGDANVRIFVNGAAIGSLTAANLGAGGTLTTLPVVTGNAVIGDLADGVAIVPFNGTLGRNFYMLSDDLTTDEETALMGFEPLA